MILQEEYQASKEGFIIYLYLVTITATREQTALLKTMCADVKVISIKISDVQTWGLEVSTLSEDQQDQQLKQVKK